MPPKDEKETEMSGCNQLCSIGNVSSPSDKVPATLNEKHRAECVARRVHSSGGLPCTLGSRKRNVHSSRSLSIQMRRTSVH